jgi:hypothetical protein
MRLEAGSAPVRMEPVAIDMTVVAKAIAPLLHCSSMAGCSKTLNGKQRHVPYHV